jgi:intracellular sulfur oxidation DsrE/DsrF family protein
MKDAPTRRTLLALATAMCAAAALPAFAEEQKVHKLAVQVNSQDPATMNLALNNIKNVLEHYKGIGDQVRVEVVTYGPGVNMLREDYSPVRERVAALKKANPDLFFKVCKNTLDGMKKSEGQEITLVPEAELVPSGAVHLMTLQEQGWSYIRP